MSTSLEQAFADWRDLGVEVLDAAAAHDAYAANTLGTKREIRGVVRARSTAEVQAIVGIANKHYVPLYPLSGGHNWGYGSSLPAADGCVLLDLSQMNAILECNAELGYVRLEPGVTQQQLYDYFVAHELPFMVPTTGAGPKGSLIGNALEKGYGITPYEDHFGALLSLKAVLPSGEIYHSAISEFGGHNSDTVFKWKIGPYLDGLFVQGNMGIVVQATIALARRPENMTQFLVFVDNAHFEQAVSTIARVKQELGSIVGGINIMNRHRLLAMIERKQEWLSKDTMAEMHIRQLARRQHLSDWVVMGGIYAPNEAIPGITKVIRRRFHPAAKRVVFMSRRRVGLLKKLLKLFKLRSLDRLVGSIERSLNILEGIPSQVALALAYIKNPRTPNDAEHLSPDADHAGLIWFSPLLPINSALVRDFTQEITRICLSCDIEPLITLTAVSERCFDSTIPLVYNLDNEDDRRNAHKCYDLLVKLAQTMGVFPYRVDIDTMRAHYDAADNPAVAMLQNIKKAVDPHHIIAPGRYSKL